MNIDADSDLLKLSDEGEEVQKETYTHQPLTEGTCQMGIVSLQK